jgi:hypothetical protein
MQHLMLALAIIMLTVIARNDRQKINADNVTRVMKVKKVREEKRQPIIQVENEFSIRTAIIDLRSI